MERHLIVKQPPSIPEDYIPELHDLDFDEGEEDI